MKTIEGEIEVSLAEKDFKLKIKDLKTQRELFERIFHYIPDGLLVVDQKNAPVFINQSAKNLFNLMGWMTDEKNPLSGSPIFELLENTKNLDFISYQREVEILEPVVKNLNVFCVPLLLPNQPSYRLFLIKDITREKLEQLNPRFNDSITFSAGFAHELGNPIASLSLHAQLLKRLLVNIPARKKQNKKQINASVEILNKELARLDDIIHRFLDAVRPTNPQFAFHSIDDLIMQVVAMLHAMAKEKNVTLRFSSGKHESFLLDEARMKQALTNVIMNAIEASPAGSIIDIQVQDKNDSCEIEIKDQGKGISSSEMTKIFDPFYTTKETGNGLGLVITYRIIKDHGGSISVKSKPGQGTTFLISIPIRRRAVKQLPAE
ncbi:MAG: PAS domain-containing sensor histidine kinase [Candidatus Aureabacteria bacterium]|nr:PAS domain-containing sensor histidine kinase [Candidatus Auribacterota bacterium]